MPSVFDEANAILTDTCLDTFGEETVFEDAEGNEIATRVVFNENTVVIGDGGVLMDERPSAEMPIADIGKLHKGSFTYQSRTFALDGFISQDGAIGKWFVRETT
jgi:hypothetical protein